MIDKRIEFTSFINHNL